MDCGIGNKFHTIIIVQSKIVVEFGLAHFPGLLFLLGFIFFHFLTSFYSFHPFTLFLGYTIFTFFYFSWKDFKYALFLDYRSVYMPVALSEPAYTQVSLVSVAYTRILQIFAGAYITLFSRFIIFLFAESFSGSLGQCQAVISPVTVPCLTGGILFWTLSSYKEC